MVTKPLARLGAMAADILLAVAMIAAVVILLLTQSAAAGPGLGQPGAKPERLFAPARLSEIGRPSLLFRTHESSQFAFAPTVTTEVRITVGGLVARASVSQTFRNPNDDWVEGVYVFPLPENAAVDHLKLKVGERVIEGQIKEREQALRIYRAAKRQGKKAGLLEGERPNIFTTSIANIGPKEEITIDIEYQQTLRYDQGAFRLRFPMVVGPRYIPGNVRVAKFGDGGWSVATVRVPDAEKISAPVLPPAFGKINPVKLSIELEPGFELSELKSSYHPVAVSEDGAGGFEIRLKDGEVPADRDFELVWKPETGAGPQAGLFTETTKDGRYILVMILPPTAKPAIDDAKGLPREVIFVIDVSGSMAGTSIRQAKAALALAIDRLDADDRFNVVGFNDTAFTLFPSPRPADRMTRETAKRFVHWLSAEGGTRMAPAVRLALRGRPPAGHIRQMVFLTDGAIGNERELFGIINDRLGDARLFTIGIGSAPNSYFMTKAAEIGRGTFTHIGDVNEVGARMAALFEKLETPVLTDLAVAWPDGMPDGMKAEMWPKRLPDLYAGEPVIFTARAPDVQGTIAVTGLIGAARWRGTLDLGGGKATPGVSKLWARDKISGLMDTLHENGDANDVRRQVVALGIGHHLVTKYTSLVAVDVTPSRPQGEPLKRRKVPHNLPNGWEYDKVFGGVPDNATRGDRKAGLMNAPAAVKSAPVVIAAARGLALPKGATAAPLHLVLGAALLVLGLIALVLVRRRLA
jgi:Ca-activated chloride channel family protein